MSGFVEKQVDTVINGIELNDLKIIEAVIYNDKIVNKYDLKIEKTCMKIFALNQPVASDLRWIMSSFSINNRLEFIGDLAVSIAESFQKLGHKPVFYNRLKFQEIFDIIKVMLRDSFKSFIEKDTKLAESVIRTDNILDKLNQKNNKILADIMKENPTNVELALVLYDISNFCELIGDNASSIAEDVFFIVDAMLIRHNYEKYLIPIDN
jgi:phosphate transport system protein